MARSIDSGLIKLFSRRVDMDVLTFLVRLRILVLVMAMPWSREPDFLFKIWNSFNSILLGFMARVVSSLKDPVVKADIS
jgi:hypothetical protein